MDPASQPLDRCHKSVLVSRSHPRIPGDAFQKLKDEHGLHDLREVHSYLDAPTESRVVVVESDIFEHIPKGRSLPILADLR